MAAGAPLLLASMAVLWLFAGIVNSERTDRSDEGDKVLSGDTSDNGSDVLDRSLDRDVDRKED